MGEIMVCGALILGVVSMSKVVAMAWSRFMRRSYVVESMASVPRRLFQHGLTRVSATVRAGHPHKEAAEERNGATASMMQAITSAGLIPYVVSPSAREDELLGQREFYSLADFSIRPRDDDIPEKACFMMTDVDYYVEWEEWLRYGHPVLMYTFSPESVADVVKNGHFVICDDYVEYHVDGGKTVVHRIWDYNQDVMYVKLKRPTFSWISWRMHPYRCLKQSVCWCFAELFSHMGLVDHANAMVFYVDQFAMSKHRRIVSLIPFARVWMWDGDLYGRELRRAKFTFGEFNVLRISTPEGPMVSLGRTGVFSSVMIPESKLEVLKVGYELSSKPQLSDTERRSKLGCDDAIILHKYLMTGAHSGEYFVHKAGDLAKHYQIVENVDEEEPNDYARLYARAPLANVEAVFPSECRANEIDTIANRVEKPHRMAARVKVRACYAEYAREFVDNVVGDCSGSPLSVEEVGELQSGPRQRQRTLRAVLVAAEKFVARAFQKREPYTVANNPRNITTCPTTHTLRLSGFTLAFKRDVLKHHHWYMPCHTPQEIAESLMRFVSKEREVVMSDFSRFDATVTEWTRRNVEFACYRRWCSATHIGELNRLLESELNPLAFTKTGIKYSPGCSRLSGSPLTTDGNTLINAFHSYATMRRCGFDRKEAMERMGLFYGDDGVSTGEVGDRAYRAVARDLGLSVKVERSLKHGQINFLSRIFPDLWSSPSSCQDPLRTLAKLHTTVQTTLPIEDCGIAKCEAYLITDAKTPLLSDWCSAYLRNTRARIDDRVVEDVPYWVKQEDDRNNSWPQCSREFLMDTVARCLGVTADEVAKTCEELNTFHGDVMSMPQLTVAPVAEKVSVIRSQVDAAEGIRVISDCSRENNNERRQGSTERIQCALAVGVTGDDGAENAGTSQHHRAASEDHTRGAHERTGEAGSGVHTGHKSQPSGNVNGGRAMFSSRGSGLGKWTSQARPRNPNWTRRGGCPGRKSRPMRGSDCSDWRDHPRAQPM